MSASLTPDQDIAVVHTTDPVLDAVPTVAPAAEPVFATRPGVADESLARVPALPASVGWRLELDWVSWAVTSLVAVAFFVLIVSGRVVTEGPVVMVLTATHGIHEGDLFALAAACGAIAVPVLRGVRRR